MDGGGSTPFTHSPEAVFRDFRGRRAGVIKALTTEVQKFHHQCDPEKENLCLFGFPDETWEVTLPPENVPPELPEPLLGINFVRDLSTEKDWLAFVAVHSDSWLLAVAFYLSAQFGFDKESRTRLFTMINDLPTIFEVVTGFAKKQVKEKTPNRSNKSNSRSKRSSAAEVRKSLPSLPPCKYDKDDIREGHEDCEEHDNTLCGACGENYSNDGFWIFCDICERWFHGKCVEITPARAEHIKLYKCPSCSNNKG